MTHIADLSYLTHTFTHNYPTSPYLSLPSSLCFFIKDLIFTIMILIHSHISNAYLISLSFLSLFSFRILHLLRVFGNPLEDFKRA